MPDVVLGAVLVLVLGGVTTGGVVGVVVSVGLESSAGRMPGSDAVTAPGVAPVEAVLVADVPAADVLVDVVPEVVVLVVVELDAGGHVMPLPSLHGLGTM